MRVGLAESQFRALMIGAVSLVVIFAYSNTLSNGFVWDDASSVLTHKHVQDPSKLRQLFREDQHAFGRGEGSFYRPLVSLSFMADFALAYDGPKEALAAGRVPELDPFLFHVINTAWHIVASLLFFALLTRLEAPRFVRLTAPLLYAVHPLHTEAVSYISGRGDSMAATFMFAGLWCAMWDRTLWRRIAGGLLSALCFAAAALCKESALIFPALLTLINAVRPVEEPEKPGLLVYAKRSIPVLVSLALLGLYVYLRQALDLGMPSAARETSVGQRLLETGQAFALYIRLIFAPTGLHMERTLEGVPGWIGAVGLALLAACAALLVVEGILRKRRRLAIAVGWFLVTWFPISGLIPLNAPMAEHWMYVPLAGFLWALAEVVWPLLRRPTAQKTARVAVYVVCVLFVVLTLARNRDWRDDETLYLATLEENPDSVRVHFNLAVVYDDLQENLPAAERHYRSVITLREAQKKELPGDTNAVLFWDDELEAHLFLGDARLEQRRYREAVEHYNLILQIEPTEKNAACLGMASYGMGKCMLAAGNRESAAALFERATQTFPHLERDVARLMM
ncbi:MAG TPA: tetratricopeptide repeat protein [Candidatus Hydrogenedentes bacterium]|nr:tetratricopeptide repeat protein [Candidatus Hydrogenedentota bacterium]